MMAVRVGVDLGGSKMLLLAISGEQRIVEKTATGADFMVRDAERAIRNFVDRYGATSVGIAIPGLVDDNGCVATSDVLPKLAGWRPAAVLSPNTVVLNDADAALTQELVGVEDCSNAALILVGTGIGAAFLVEGQRLRGAHGWAGELGGLPLIMNHEYMTLDSVASGAAILKQVGEPLDVVVAKAKRGDPDVLRVINKTAKALGAGLASVINLLNPELLIIAGGTLRWPGYTSAALESARSLSMPQLWETCSVRQSSYNEELVALGAARAGEAAGQD